MYDEFPSTFVSPLLHVDGWMRIENAAPDAHTDDPAQRETALLLLDNHGGFSHAGRRIALYSDGNYSDTSYSDVIGSERTRRGTYTLDAQRTNLTLLPAQGETEHLYRVDLVATNIGF